MKYTVIFLSLLVVVTAGCIYVPDELRSIGTPVVQTFEATPSIIKHGDTSSLWWNVPHAQSVHIDNGIGDVATNGTVPVLPNATTVYTLTARNAIGIATARTQIIVQTGQSAQSAILSASAPRIILFVSDRMSILPGEEAVLRWSVLEATQVMLTSIDIIDTSVPVDASSEIRVHPTATTTYVLTSSNPAGDSTSSLTVTVLSSPSEDFLKETNLVLNALPDESGSLIKGTQYLDYMKQDIACVGDTSLNQASRAFLSFDVSSIPANAVIQEAILDLSQYVKTGNPSYVRSAWGNMGALEVYHVQYGNYDDLGLTAYNKVAKLVQNGVFTSYPRYSWAWDVKNANDGSPVIQNLVQMGAMRCQFRIQFFTSTNWDGISDSFCFDNATLTIKYISPE